MKTTLLLLFFIVIWPQRSSAQEERSADSGLYLKAFVAKDEVLLRWAPKNKYLWKDALTDGYRLQRKTIIRQGEVLVVPEIRELHPRILPQPVHNWEATALHDPMAAVVAQSIYGDTFEISEEAGSDAPTTMILETDELNKRYAFSLYACDLSYRAAVMAGLGYRDTTVVTGESYLYELIPVSGSAKSSTGVVIFVAADQTDSLPVPEAPVGVVSDSLVTLVWNFTDNLDSYSAYNIERSSQGGSYEVINEQPVTATSLSAEGAVSYTDHPGSPGDYSYRVVGLDYFGNQSLPSPSFEVNILRPFMSGTEITGFRVEDGNVFLNWQIYKGNGAEIDHLELRGAPQPLGPFMTLKDTIYPYPSQLKISQQDGVMYYKMLSKDRYGRSRESATFQVQIADTFPPGIPQNLKIKFSEESKLLLSWDKVSDKDLIGYDIFMAPGPNSDFSQLNTKPVKITSFAYPVNSRNSLVSPRFLVRSVDKRFNVSPSSEPVTYHFKPPLAAPVISEYKYQFSKGLELKWVVMPLKGIRYLVYRQDEDLRTLGKWELLSVVGNAKEEGYYRDTEVFPGKLYRYLVTCRNSTEEESAPSEMLTVRIPAAPIREEKGKLWADANREDRMILLRWKLKTSGLSEVLLYRRSGQDKFRLYKSFSGEVNRYSDTDVVPNTDYAYLVTGRYRNGEQCVIPETMVKY